MNDVNYLAARMKTAAITATVASDVLHRADGRLQCGKGWTRGGLYGRAKCGCAI